MDPFTVEELEDNFDCDYDEYERLCDERRKEFEQYLGEFEADLVAAGLKDATIDKHYGNLDFYLNTYLLRLAPLDVRAGCYKIGDFLGNFFIRKCMWSTPETIKSNCASFKKFYKSMLAHGRVSQDDYDFVCSTIKEDKQEWCDLCTEFNDPYSENPFSPFAGLSPFGGDMWAPSAGSPFDDNPLDDPELTDEERQSILDIAHTVIDMLSEQGMSQDEMIGAVEDLMGQLDFEGKLYGMADDELLMLVANLGVAFGRDELSDLMRASVSGPEVADKICEKTNLDLEDQDYDDLVCILGILWDRWLPDEPSDALFLAQVAEGYFLYEGDERTEALELWGTAWESLKRIVRVGGGYVLTSQEPVAIDHSVPEWLAAYGQALEDEAAHDPAFAETSKRFNEECEALLSEAAKR